MRVRDLPATRHNTGSRCAASPLSAIPAMPPASALLRLAVLAALALQIHAFEYIGCYRDQFAAGDRDLLGSLLLNDNNANLIAPQYCEDYCGQRQFKFVGIQFGSECWCGNSYGKHGKLDESECGTPCVGDSSLKNRCGGALSNSIYRVTNSYAQSSANPNDGRPLLGLVMIVKDEAHTLPTTLAPLAPFIDYYYILDTGSKDGTQDAIRKVLGPKGEVWEEPFIDYGRSRNRALDIAQTAKNPPIFSLMLSADETVHNPQALRRFCEEFRNAEGAMHEAYPIQMDVGWKFDSVRLSRTDKSWRYVGRVHEYLAAPDQKWRPSLRVPDAWIQFQVTDPERRGNREYKIRDILLEEVRDHPTDTRASFYLARTYNVIRNHTASLAEFRRRIALGGWAEEIYESYYAIAFQKEALGEPWALIHEAFLDAYNYAPDRGEPLFNIAQHYYATSDQKALAYPYAATCASLPYPKDAVLWVQADVYRFQCLMYQGLAGLHIKSKHVEGYAALLKALVQQPGDYTMAQAKAAYEAGGKLSAQERTAAECIAGVAKDPATTCVGVVGAANVPCAPCAASSAGEGGSLATRIATDTYTPEQSNFGREVDGQQHIPASLRSRYPFSPTFSMAGQSKSTLFFMLVLFAAFIGVSFFVLKKLRVLNWLQLKLLGGKRAHASSSGAGEKFV